MKCLMRMFAEEDKGVVFYETVLTIKAQRHTYIECVPLPWEQFELIPGYFKVRSRLVPFCRQDAQSILSAGIHPHVGNGVVTTQEVD